MVKPKLPELTQNQIDFVNIALKLFKVNDVTADKVLTYSQKVIFYSLVSGKHKRLQIIASTQYGKSLTVALACLYLTCISAKNVAVIAPSNEKAKIIVRYYIEHLGDSAVLYQALEKNSKLDRLRQEENKSRILLNNGGGIFVVSAQERNSLKSIESAMGMGAEIVIGDEYCLVNDTTEATIFRMIAGKGENAIYCKIGNPFYVSEPYSHFKKSWDSGKYHRIFIDDNIGLEEGRYNKDFLEEAKTKPMYDVLFKSEFPTEDEIDKDGYRLLLSTNDLKIGDLSLIDKQDGDLILGIDVGGGGDESKFVIRKGNFAFLASTLNTTDTMLVSDEADRLVELYGIKKSNVFIDDTGIGRGVSDKMKQNGYFNCGVSFGGNAWNKDLFSNRRAEMYWEMSQWVKAGGVLDSKCNEWAQTTWTRYKVQTSEKRIIMEEKERVKAKYKRSPDTADALCLTFFKVNFIGII